MTMLYIRTVSSLVWLAIVRKNCPNLSSFCTGTAARLSTMAYSVQESGSLHTHDYKIYISECKPRHLRAKIIDSFDQNVSFKNVQYCFKMQPDEARQCFHTKF